MHMKPDATRSRFTASPRHCSCPLSLQHNNSPLGEHSAEPAKGDPGAPLLTREAHHARESLQSKSTGASPCSPGSLGPFGFLEPSTTFMVDWSMPYFSWMKAGRSST